MKKILIAADDAAWRSILKRLLGEKEYAVSEAADGRETIGKFYAADRRLAERLGADKFLTKPLDQRDLLAALDDLLGA